MVFGWRLLRILMGCNLTAVCSVQCASYESVVWPEHGDPDEWCERVECDYHDSVRVSDMSFNFCPDPGCSSRCRKCPGLFTWADVKELGGLLFAAFSLNSLLLVRSKCRLWLVF
jgi:hypothetical protein